MEKYIKKAVVLGTGAMASGIAAHLANAGVPTLLLGRIPSGLNEDEKKKGLGFEDKPVRNRQAAKSLERIVKGRPPALYDPACAELLSIGNYDDDLPRIADADWIIESVVENLAVKKDLLNRVVKYRKPGAILSTNTSGISVNVICEDLPDETKRHFLGTHFFNPARYMKLLEIIPADETMAEVVDFMAAYCERVLGKGIVRAKDTPGFVSNRIGITGGNPTILSMIELGMTIEEVDVVTGIQMGRSPLATFLLQDMVGLDVCMLSLNNVTGASKDAEEIALFETPKFVSDLVDRGDLGDKTGKGWYEKSKNPKENKYLDYNTGEYVPLQYPVFASVEEAKKAKGIEEKFNIMVYSDDKAGNLAWDITRKILNYAGTCLPEIADDIVSVDNAMKWGYNWALGPFENWDAIGVGKSVERMKAEGIKVAEVALDLLASGKSSFYTVIDGKKHYFDYKTKEYVPVKVSDDLIDLAALKADGKVIEGNASASLIDIGDDVACLELHPPGNKTNAEVMGMIELSVRKVENSYAGLVIINRSSNALDTDYEYLLGLAKEDRKAADEYLKRFQDAVMSLKHCAKPVVAAISGKTRGNGLEIALHAHKIRAAAESAVGFVDFSYGLVPAGGGLKELNVRSIEGVFDDKTWLHPMQGKLFGLITNSRPVGSAPAARAAAILRNSDGITMNTDFLLYDAKRDVLELAAKNFIAPQEKPVRVLGEEGVAGLTMMAYMMKEGLFISEYDFELAKKTAYVLNGGNIIPNTKVNEQLLLDIERETFLSLIVEPKTQERLESVIATGRPLKN
ncbi:MAG: 3-hydroxyacyl-CoA dehydrogenase/enoyl-CoA hydratase family protein [Clostridiales Family XIII bacterium]|jgi:3-hydroxyacyl-CoA dehydrogenase|nr:3-hydroxyacyl-CoA dehydrogenase/enoyl-CoA hydratase family protein [Clostridiales Family XIII bacterium]